MTDSERLLSAFEHGRLLRPTGPAPGLVDLALALACIAGAPDVATTPGSRTLAAHIGSPDHLVFILADGLGINLIEDLPGGLLLSRYLAAELRTVFPSSSAVALTTLATGLWPAKHGVTGQWTHIPEADGAAGLLQFATRNGGRSLSTLGVPMERAFPYPPLISGFVRDTLALYPEHLANSTSTGYFVGAKPRASYRTLADAVEQIHARVRHASGPTYTYLYAPNVDLEAHRFGIGHPMTRAAVMDLNLQLDRLADALAGDARIVISADHGLLDTPPNRRHVLRPTSDLFDLLRFPPSGDTRVTYLHAKPHATEAIARHFRERYGGFTYVITTDEAEALMLFGPEPLADHTRDRLGDVMVISAGVDVLEYVNSGRVDRLSGILSHHSGMTSAEMRIPLIVV